MPDLQPLHQVRVADEVPPEEQGVVAAGLEDAPAVLVVEAARGEEGRVAHDLAEDAEVDVREAPGAQEGVLLLGGEDLFVALVAVALVFWGI